MSREGEIWREYKKTTKERKKVYAYQALLKLERAGLKVVKLKGDGQYRVGDFDFYPTSEKFCNQKTKQRGKGVENLIKILL